MNYGSLSATWQMSHEEQLFFMTAPTAFLGPGEDATLLLLMGICTNNFFLSLRIDDCGRWDMSHLFLTAFLLFFL